MRVVYSFMRLLLLTLAFCSLFAAGCGDDDYGKGSLDFAAPDDGGEEMGPVDFSMPDLSAAVDTDAGDDSGMQ
jgi:hypothetical protein